MQGLESNKSCSWRHSLHTQQADTALSSQWHAPGSLVWDVRR